MSKASEALEAERARMEKKFGKDSAALGSKKYSRNVVSTGITGLDYALGTGGWPRRFMSEIFGPPDVGKSSILGIAAMNEAQKLGMTPGIIALEPGFDEEWAELHGLDTDNLLIGRPDDGHQAFQMLYDWVTGDTIDFIIFDSIGAVLRESEMDEKATGPAAMGQAGLITWGLKRCVMPLWKKNKCLLLINQVRDDQKSRITGLLDSPGGHALKHGCPVRIQMRFGKDKDYSKDNDGSDSYTYTVGQQIVCTIKRNKMSRGTGKRAQFMYFYDDVDGHPFGIDWVEDTLSTALRAGVITRAGGVYRHPLFPEQKNGNHQVSGRVELEKLFQENPKVVETIRREVLTVMSAKIAPTPQVEEDDDGEED
jgi:recombination protein RecA